MLTPQQRLFVREYLAQDPLSRSATKAAIASGYSEKTAYSQGARLLKHVEIVQLMDEQLQAEAAALAKREAGLMMTAENLISRLWDIGTADPRDLIELRRVCCRFCYGEGHLYQEKPAERHRRRQQYEELLAEVLKKAKGGAPIANLGEFDELGGVGYDPRKPPVGDCPECFGEGTEVVFPKDTRSLSPQAAALYDGVEITATGGLKIKMKDQTKCMELVGRRFNLFGDRQVLQNPDGSAIKAVEPFRIMAVYPKLEGPKD